MSAQRTPALRTVKPGSGTLAALRHVCPHCSASLGVRCTTPDGSPLHHVHSKRMDLAAAASRAGSAS